MPEKIISFDIGDTLLRDRWRYDSFACDCLENIGIAVNREHASEIYRRIFGERYPSYVTLNLKKDYDGGDIWWHEVTAAFLEAIGEDPSRAAQAVAGSHEMLYHGESRYFPMVPFAKETLVELKLKGYKLGVISNWDMSIHRSLKGAEIDSFFDVIIASGEVGAEKPDARIYQSFCDGFQCEPSEVIHIGDNPIADVQGCLEFGMSAIYFNEQVEPSFENGWQKATVSCLSQIPKAIESCA